MFWCQMCPLFICLIVHQRKEGEESGQQWGMSEGIECFTEDQAFLQSNDSGPRPPPSRPLSRQQITSLSQSSCLSPVELILTGEGGRGAKSYDRERAWPSINHSILFGAGSPPHRP